MEAGTEVINFIHSQLATLPIALSKNISHLVHGDSIGTTVTFSVQRGKLMRISEIFCEALVTPETEFNVCQSMLLGERTDYCAYENEHDL